MNNIEQRLYNRALEAMRQAYCPYSMFSVGACLLADDNHYYIGCNIENMVLGLTQCAEANAVGNMIVSGSRRIKAMMIATNHHERCQPCGQCRQLFYEFADASLPIYSANQNKITAQWTLEKLLPEPFQCAHENFTFNQRS